MTLLDYSLIFFLGNIGIYFLWILKELDYLKIEKYKSHNSTSFFSKNPLMHKFFVKYSFFTNLLKINFPPPLMSIVLYAIWLNFLVDYYSSVLDLFIGFNIGFILIILGTILFLLIICLKLSFLKKEFMTYKLKILKNVDDIELFKLIVTNGLNATKKNQYYQKMFNKIKNIIVNERELQGEDLLKFLVKNFKVLNSFYWYLYSCRDELNLNFKFKKSVLMPDNFYTFISFTHGVTLKDLYGKEVYEIFVDYINSF